MKFLFSENFSHWNFFTSRNFTRVGEGVLTVISCSFWCPLLARCHYYLIFKLHLGGTYLILQDQLVSSELLLSAISEANTDVNRAAQRAKESKKWGAYIKLDEKTKIRIGKYSSENGIIQRGSEVLLDGARVQAVGEIEIFVPIQSMSLWQNFSPAKFLSYTVAGGFWVRGTQENKPFLISQ